MSQFSTITEVEDRGQLAYLTHSEQILLNNIVGAI